MARLVLEIPDVLPFATTIDVRVTDLNYGNHLGNDAVLSLIHEARVRYLASLGATELQWSGCSIVVADCAIVYRAECFLGDRLRFEVGPGDVSRVACDLLYRAVREQDGRLCIEAKTGIVFLDPSTRRPVRVPADVARATG
ncbi:MAG: thioesterase family protein [Planctomycetes bacterium]|nr:thioesterase family protein [Planctomycetota bacterium]